MKPNWKDAPEWAQWLAQDEAATWWWYEKKPVAEINGWNPRDDRSRPIGKSAPDWRETLAPRPNGNP